MPAKTAQDWFITLSPLDESDLDQKQVQSLVLGKDHYVWRETGKSGTHPHYHVYVRYPEAVRSDRVKEQWKKVWLIDEVPKVAMLIKACTDKTGLIGKYAQKELDNIVVSTSFSDSEIEYMKSQCPQKTATEALDGYKRRQVTLVGAADIVEKYAKKNGMSYESHDEFRSVIKSMMDEGYRFSTIWGRLKTVWSELMMMSGKAHWVTLWSDDKY